MKRALIRILKRVFAFIVVVFIIYLVVSNLGLLRDLVRKDTLRILVDTDAGYGMDDSFALSRILADPEAEVMGVLSSQWHYADLRNDSTLFLSHEINYRILELFNQTHIPQYRGSELPLRFNNALLNPGNRAARFIADRAMEMVSGKKLTVLCLGPLTNLATAIKLKPESASRIACYMMGPLYEPSKRIWNKNEFNAQNDLEALDMVLNTEDLELHVMPAGLSSEMVFTRSEIEQSLQGEHEVLRHLRAGLSKEGMDTDSLDMSSVALVEALIHPEMASEKQVFTPPENIQRKVSVYTRLDVTRMKKDYWKTINRYIEIF